MLTLKRKRREGVAYIPLHYMKVVLPNGKVVRALHVIDEGGRIRIVDLNGKVIIIGGG